MEQRYARSQNEKQAAEVGRDSVRRDKDKLRDDNGRLQAKVNTLEHEARRTKGGGFPGPTAEGDPESPRAQEPQRMGGGGGRPTPPAPGSSWPVRRRGMCKLRQRRGRCPRWPPDRRSCRPTWRSRLGSCSRLGKGRAHPCPTHGAVPPPHRPAVLDADFGGGGGLPCLDPVTS